MVLPEGLETNEGPGNTHRWPRLTLLPVGVGPGCTDETLLSAIASALHTSTAPITGQLSAAVEKNPGVWLNTAQPLCKAFMVTDEDIRYRLPLGGLLGAGRGL